MLLVVLAAVAGAPGVSRAADQQPEPGISTTALALTVPDQDPVYLASASAPPQARADVRQWASPDRPVSAYRAVAEAADDDAGGRTASIMLRGTRLWGGEVRIRSLDLASHVDTTGETPSLVIDTLKIDTLHVPGLTTSQPLDPGASFAVADWGTLTTGEVAADGSSIVALRLVLTADHRGLPAGTELLLGVVSIPPPAPAPPADDGGGSSSGSGDHGKGSGNGDGVGSAGGSQGGGSSHHGGGHTDGGNHEGGGGGQAQHHAPPAVHLPPNIHAHLTKGGFVFPVWGPVSFSNDFGAPRADTVWHHGNDIFAPKGAPILAVTSGTLRQIGWNELGGQRLWLEADDGTVSFYYAHLSAYAPLAKEGAHVEAGQVIGFVGNTGDAVGTPFHLHFEVHPTALDQLGYDGVVNPYPFLLAWKHLKDRPMVLGPKVKLTAPGTPPRAIARLIPRPEGAAVAEPALEPLDITALQRTRVPQPKAPAHKNDENHLAIRENGLSDLVRALRRGGA